MFNDFNNDMYSKFQGILRNKLKYNITLMFTYMFKPIICLFIEPLFSTSVIDFQGDSDSVRKPKRPRVKEFSGIYQKETY